MGTTTTHLTGLDIERFRDELDAIRDEVMSDLGEDDARYIRRVIAVRRGLEAAARGSLLVSLLPPAWLAGTAMLTVAKILDNMEIGHNVLHGQWDWMRDPEIHSTTWDWDFASTTEGWKHSHNYVHHTWTNVVGKDRDLGYSMLRVDPRQPWHPIYLAQPVYNLLLATVFDWGVAVYDIELENLPSGKKPWSEAKVEFGKLFRRVGRLMFKEYVAFPLLSGPSAVPAFLGSLTANVIRNVWAHAVIVCGHFPDGAEAFDEEEIEGESRGEWYLRQMRGSANIDGSWLTHIMTGNLSHQIEHHLFPDMPSNRYAQVAPKVRALCERYGIPYTSGSLLRQYGNVLGRIFRFAFPGGGEPRPSGDVSSPPARLERAGHEPERVDSTPVTAAAQRG